jgi:chromosome segregation protein
MQLKSLELVGFKSFAKKTVFNFTTPITAIVGPNGSGKSNVAEAFQFVLGEQSIKSMRGKKTEDLIFNGSKEVARSNRASVKLLFDNRKRLFSIDYDEVVIERVIYRDASSEYLINGSQVRLKDVIELLSASHTGTSGHHIISQGEADRVLSANPKERRAMVEDALGLKLYQYKKEEAQWKLDKTAENIMQVELVRKEVIPHLKFLKRQVEKIERAQAMKHELVLLYHQYLKREELYLKRQKADIKSRRSGPETRKAELARSLIEAKAVLESSTGRDEKSDELVSLEHSLDRDRKRFDALSRELGRLEGTIATEERRLSLLEKAGANTETETIPLSPVKKFFSEVEGLLDQVSGEASISEIGRLIGTIKGLIKSFFATLRAESYRLKEHRDIENDLEAFRKQQTDLEKKISLAEKEEHSTRQAIVRLKADIDREKDTNRDAEKRVFQIIAEQNDVGATLQVLQAAEEKLALEEANFKREIQEGVAIIGRDISLFHQCLIDEEQAISEDRSVQETRRREIEKIKVRLEDAGGGTGEDVLKEYKEVSERESFLVRELADLDQSKNSLIEIIADLEERLSAEFAQGLGKINQEFQRFFTLMFGGGVAALELVKIERKLPESSVDNILDSAIESVEKEKVEEGIDIKVSLPNKKIKGLMMLSGGERALTSIALIFAMSQVNPPPFIVLDETDAALDEANSKKYGDMIESLAKCSELILITHNRETMSRAGVLYGITMGVGGVSKILSIAFDEAVAVAK